MAENNNNNWKRPLPTNELDLNLMLTDTQWGNSEVSPSLREALKKKPVDRESLKKLIIVAKDGEEYIKISDLWEFLGQYAEEKDLWSMLSLFTRDQRLGNLSKIGELPFVRYHNELASDFLASGCQEPFKDVMVRSANIIETSQSKDGFLRKRHGTFSQEIRSESIEPKKKNILGMQKGE